VYTSIYLTFKGFASGSFCEVDCTTAQGSIADRFLEYRLTIIGEGSGNNYAYLVTDDKTKQAVIIDPANPSESVLALGPDIKHALTSAQGSTAPKESNRQWHQVDKHHQYSPVSHS